ncbi:MAG: carboxyl transferase domain-containing protein [Acidimicrobiales bacterium]
MCHRPISVARMHYLSDDDVIPNSVWKPELDELRRRERLAEDLGGAEKVARQHHFGKQTVRERIEQFVDEGSFWEIGKTAGVAEYDDEGELVGFVPSNFVFGLAEVDGRPAVVSGDDFTVRGGSNDASISSKREASESIALEMQLPHIRLVDGMAGGGSVKTIEQSGRTYIPVLPGWNTVLEHANVAPSVALALGSVAGFGALRVASAHYCLIVQDTAQMMIAGPALVEQAALGTVSKEELGSALIHSRNGAVDDVVQSETEAFERTLHFLSYLPSSVYELPPIEDFGDAVDRRDESLLDVVPRDPRQAYDMRSIVASVFDLDSFFEIGRHWGTSIIGGCPADGIPMAVYAEDPRIYGGVGRRLRAQTDTAARPRLHVSPAGDPSRGLSRIPDRQRGRGEGHDPLRRHGHAALHQLSTPYCTVVIRKAFGVAGASNRKPGTTSLRLAWPSGDWGSLPIEGGLEVAYKAELARSADPEG